MNPPPAPSITTHLILPAWWVQAFEATVLGEQRHFSAIEQSLETRLTPALSSLELGALATVLSALQEQLLAGAFHTLKLPISQLVKEVGTQSRNKHFLIEKVAQVLTSIKILNISAHDIEVNPLFRGDQWSLGGRNGQEISVILEPSSIGLELILGLSDAHLDLLRGIRKVEPTLAALDQRAPLVVWKSLWLELIASEPLLYLRLERAIQWDFKWLQLDGTFGITLASLFRGFDLDFPHKLRLLARLGKCLQGHGFMGPIKTDQYLAFDREEDLEPMLIWQVGRERLLSQAANFYDYLAHKSLLNSHRLGGPEPWIRLFSSLDLSPELWTKLQKGWDEIVLGFYQSTTPPSHAFLEGHYRHIPNQLLSPAMIFFELITRHYSTATNTGEKSFPIPAEILQSPIGPLLSDSDAASLGERFNTFLRLMEDAPELTSLFKEVPYATFTAPISLKNRTLTATLSERVKTPAEPYHPIKRGESIKQTQHKPSSLKMEAQREPLPSQLTPPSTQMTPVLTTNGQEAAETEPLKPEPKSSPSTSRMLKIAAEELHKIKKNHPDQYQALKKAYFDSLDDGGRKLILDVQKRMQTHLFEEHLRQRLLRFMIAHPGAWRSADRSSDK